jgi:hypothetical protein
LKQICFLVSLPRAGNTVLASVLNQNKKIGCTANSIVFELLHRINETKNNGMFTNFPDHGSINNVSKKIIENYYEDWKHEIIIDRSPATTPKNLEYYSYQNHKFIFLKRNLIEIVKSFVNLALKNDNKKPIEEIYQDILNPNSILQRGILAVTNGMKTIQKEKYIVIDYNDFVRDPKKEINNIYKFLNIESFEHNFKNLDQFSINGIQYNDNIFDSFKNIHTINTQSITKIKYSIELPQYVIDFCRNLENEVIL